MPIKPKVDPKKQQADRLQELLKSLLTDDENKYCADCDAKQPRWASWNLGVFLCIRCAGIHRNLGVHISRVKSVSLDTWLPEQVQSMRVMGNAKAKAVYEALLPDGFRRPQNDQALEMFIRAKYDQKKYIMKGWAPPKVDVSDLPSLTEPIQKTTAKKFVPIGDIKVPPTSSAKSQQKEDSLVDLFGNSNPAPAQSNDLFSLNSAPKSQPKQESGDLDDLFGPIVSAPNASIPQHQQQINSDLSDGLASINFGTAPTTAAPQASKVDDIMSLFNKPPNLTAMHLAGQQPIIQNPSGTPQPQQSAFNSFHFSSPAQQVPLQTPQQQGWAGNWTTPTQPAAPNLMTTSMPSYQPPPQQQSMPKSQSNAFDDLFAQAQTAFGQPQTTPQLHQHKPAVAATTAPSNAAQNDLEALFM